MKSAAALVLLIAAWLVAEAVLYWSFVPHTLAPANFLFVSAVLTTLLIVGIVKWRGARWEQSIGTMLYNADHSTGRKT